MRKLKTVLLSCLLVMCLFSTTAFAKGMTIASKKKSPVFKKTGTYMVKVPASSGTKVRFKAPKKGTYKVTVTDMSSDDESGRFTMTIGKTKYKLLDTRYFIYYQNKLFEGGTERQKSFDKMYTLSAKMAAKGWATVGPAVKVKLSKGQVLTIKHSCPKSRLGGKEPMYYSVKFKKVKK